MSRLSVLCIYNNGAGFHGDEGDSSAVCEPLNLLFLGAAVCREQGSELASTFITWGPLIRALLQSQISAIVTVCWWVWRDWNWLPWRPVTTSTNLNTYFCFLLGRSLSGAPPVVGTETEGRAIYMRPFSTVFSCWYVMFSAVTFEGVRYVLPTAPNLSARSWDDPLYS